ncbi:MAG TPA: alkaline phosphatase PhoX, partial [Thermoleophilaceae bacterium]|nr:alkaline phosphatase PhoX [Thermoleophilaceae bacterium]
GPLQPPNEVGLMLPQGFTGRQIARGGKLVEGTAYPWHFAPDGAATYRAAGGGHVLVSNSEAPSALGGGASAIRFGADGSIESAYRVLEGSNLNCAGGPTPWGTWLSGEEHEGGMIWEADPAGILPPVPRPALGNFSHEAAAVDPRRKHVYLTEDQGDGCFYRFTPDSYPSLASGRLEVAVVAPDNSVGWREVPDPNVVTQAAPTRSQVPEATRFDGGEGLWHHDGIVYFTTKGDRRVWAYDTRSQTLDVLYDRSLAPDAALTAVDNVTVSPYGDVYVCEDGGNMEICLITPDRVVAPFCRLGLPDGSVAPDHEGSEMAGVVFDPSGTRMYFSSQRAYPYVAGTPLADGATYEVTGPFRLPTGDGALKRSAFGPPAGERDDGSDYLIGDVDGLAVDARGGLSGSRVRVRIELDRPGAVHLALRTFDLESEASGDATHDRPRPVTLARSSRTLSAGGHALELALDLSARWRLLGARVDAILTVLALDSAGGRRVVARRLAL